MGIGLSLGGPDPRITLRCPCGYMSKIVEVEGDFVGLIYPVSGISVYMGYYVGGCQHHLFDRLGPEYVMSQS